MKTIHKIGLITALAVVVALLLAPAALAAGPNGKAGKSKTAHLYLYEKDPVTWQIVPGGAWGKMTYRTAAPEFWFVFNGKKLTAGASYTLIYYPDPWPGTGLICLGTGTANGGRNVHIAGSVDTGDLPIAADANYPTGAKIWLVLSSDVDCTGKLMIAWQPTEYLFENQLITFDDTSP